MAEKRLAICKDCEFSRRIFSKHLQCRKCKCLIDIKARLKSSKCPARKWPK